MSNFSNNLVYIRKAKKLNQKQMAELLKIKQSTYANYETDFSKPELDTFITIAKVLRVSMDDLIHMNLSLHKKYSEPDALDEAAELEDPINDNEKQLLSKQQELLFKIIELNEKLLSRTEELIIKDNTIAELTEKIKRLQGEQPPEADERQVSIP